MTTSDLERRLREGLLREAEQINPRERRTEILAMIHDEKQAVEPQRRWFIPVAAAASVALIGGLVWGLSGFAAGQQGGPTVANPNPSSSANAAVPGPTPSQVSAPSTQQVAGAGTQMVLPAYFVGADSAARLRFGLYREFVSVTVPVPATPARRARAALTLAMNPGPFTSYEPYVNPWSATSVQNLTATPQLITITLSGPGGQGFTVDQTRLAVQELVWTAQAAIGQGPIPVKFVIAGGSTKLFGTFTTAPTYNRPGKDLTYQVLAPIWISSPHRGQTYSAGTTVVAQGESCAFEAATQWQLKEGGRTIKSGVTTASSGCPTRGTWSVNLGVLRAGDYTFRMDEVSMQTGQGLVAEASKPFTVR